MTQNTVFVVLCEYSGCYECDGEGTHTHILCVSSSLEEAKKFAIEHSKERSHHGHPFHVEIYETKLGQDFKKTSKLIHIEQNVCGCGDYKKKLNVKHVIENSINSTKNK